MDRASLLSLTAAEMTVLVGGFRAVGANDAQDKFVQDFVAAWHKVMNLDRFDLA